MSYRVVYGETMPAWERIFATRRKAIAFSKRCETRGDAVFSVALVRPGETPQSLMAALDAGLPYPVEPAPPPSPHEY